MSFARNHSRRCFSGDAPKQLPGKYSQWATMKRAGAMSDAIAAASVPMEAASVSISDCRHWLKSKCYVGKMTRIREEVGSRTAPRNLKRFLESINWDKERPRDRYRQIIARKRGHPEAIDRFKILPQG